MTAEIITIGNELMIGQVVDSNSAWLAQQLNLAGISVSKISSIPDSKETIIKAIDDARKNAELVITSGGLGPTSDDITKQTLCEYFNTKLVFDKSVYKSIEQIFLTRALPLTELNRQQAEVPECSIPLTNKLGTAPGLWFHVEDFVLISLPGVPYELKAMFEKEVLPRLKSRFVTEFIYHRTLITIGIPESFLAELINDWEKQLPQNISLAYLPSGGMVRLRLSSAGKDKDNIEKNIEAQIQKLLPQIQNYFLGFDDDSLEKSIGDMLKKKNMTVVTAESCTGGNIARMIIKVPGSSGYYKGSLIAYSDELKINLLQVPANIIEKYGAVSEETARLMAENARRILDSDYSVACTGIAGPGGGTAAKPVGTVWISIAGPDKTIAQKFEFGGNRESNIHLTAITGLNLLRKELQHKN